MAVKSTEHSSQLESCFSSASALATELTQGFCLVTKTQEEFRVKVDLLSNDIKSAIKLQKRELSDMKTDQQSILVHLQESSEFLDTSRSRLDSVCRSSDSLIECLKIQNSLDQQDENDRESIALLGHKAEPCVSGAYSTRNSRPPITLDSSCMSCSNQKAVVIHAFKIACLLYMPSTVEFYGNSYHRQTLLEAQKHILDCVQDSPVEKPGILQFLEIAKQGRFKGNSVTRDKQMALPFTAKLDEFPRVARRK